MDKISYGRQYIDNDDINMVIKALLSDMITQGDYIVEFENALKKYTSAKYAVALSSGTAALHISYLALGLEHNDEIVTTANTFAATSNACLYCNGIPKFVDINSDDFLIDDTKIEEQITNKTKIIAPVHYAGLTCNMENILALKEKYNLYVVEDACHGLGSSYNNHKTGNLKYSDIAVFSFHPVKHITTGEGGAILTNNEEIYKKCCALRSHGIYRDNFINQADSPVYHEMQMLGYNYRMTDIQAALGISQLNKLDNFTKRRKEIAEIYYKEFSNCSYIQMQKQYDNRENSYHLFPILFENNSMRDKVYNKLKENNIFTQIHYMPVTKHPYYEKLGYSYKNTINAYNFYKRELSLPIYPALKNDEVYMVINKIKHIVEG